MSEGNCVDDHKADKRTDTGSAKPVDLKAERLAEALRANLKRRKSQARDRRQPEDADRKDQD